MFRQHASVVRTKAGFNSRVDLSEYDARLARQLLDWTPRYITIESIIESAWRWHQSHPRGYATARA